MAKRKKKHHKPGFDKISKAQHKNEFLYKLRHVMNLAGERDVFYLLPERELDIIYMIRYQPMRAIAAPGSKIPPDTLKEINTMISGILRSEKVKLTPGGAEIRMDEYLTVGQTLLGYLVTLKDDAYKGASEIKYNFSLFINDMERDKKTAAYLKAMNSLLGPYFSRLDKQILWGKFEVKFGFNGLFNIVNCFEISCHVPDKIELTLDGYTRPAFKVGWCFDGEKVEHIQIKYSDLNSQTSFTDMPVDIYIQSHALVRLYERIDCIKHGVIMSSLLESLKNCKAVHDKNGHYLIEFRLSGIKVGYLPAIIFAGNIVIRTFLFLTFGSTPEGKKLMKLTGMNKTDQKYLALDTVSTYMTTDIGKDEEIKNIFNKSGCGGLLKLHDSLAVYSIPVHAKQTDKMLADYLGLRRI